MKRPMTLGIYKFGRVFEENPVKVELGHSLDTRLQNGKILEPLYQRQLR